MSLSYKHTPCAAITCCESAKEDKRHAHRGERRAQDLALRKELMTGTFENFLLPHRYECSNNDNWGWNRDGSQRYYSPAKYGHEDWFAAMMRK